MDASITQSPRNPKTKPCYEVINDREDHDDESDAQAAMRVIEDKPLHSGSYNATV